MSSYVFNNKQISTVEENSFNDGYHKIPITEDIEGYAISKNNLYVRFKNPVMKGTENNIVIGLNPEFIKYKQKLPFPDLVFVSRKSFHPTLGLNNTEIEFPSYMRFFFNKTKLNIVCYPDQIEHLSKLFTNYSLYGVEDLELVKKWSEQQDPVLKRILCFINHYPICNMDGEWFTHKDFINFYTYDRDGVFTYDMNFAVIDVHEKKSNYGEFDFIGKYYQNFINKNTKDKDINFYIDTNELSQVNLFCGLSKHKYVNDKFGFYCISSGSGMPCSEPALEKHTTSLMLVIDGKPFLLDPMAYTREFMKNSPFMENNSLFKHIFVSHIHADHDQGAIREIILAMLNKPEEKTKIYGLSQTLSALIGKVQTIFKISGQDISVEDIKNVVDFVELPVGKRFKLKGFDNVLFEVETGVHSIPSAMLKVFYLDGNHKVLNSVGYSGDTQYDPELFEELAKQLDKETMDKIRNFFKNVNHVIHESGGLPIHTEADKFLLDHFGQNIYFVHTGKDEFSFDSFIEKNKNKYSKEELEENLKKVCVLKAGKVVSIIP